MRIIELFSRLFLSPVQSETPQPSQSPIITDKAPEDRDMAKYASEFLRAVEYVLDHEAGYVDHPRDPGGATNMGITQGTLSEWRGYPVSKQDVRDLKRSEAIAIYHAAYWDAARCDSLPAALAYAVFDFAVNSGPARAVKKLQSVLGVGQDGIIGGITLRAIQRRSGDLPDIVNAYMDARLRFMKVIRNRSTGARLWDTFGRGWQKRVNDVRARSLEFTGGGGW